MVNFIFITDENIFYNELALKKQTHFCINQNSRSSLWNIYSTFLYLEFYLKLLLSVLQRKNFTTFSCDVHLMYSKYLLGSFEAVYYTFHFFLLSSHWNILFFSFLDSCPNGQFSDSFNRIILVCFSISNYLEIKFCSQFH